MKNLHLSLVFVLIAMITSCTKPENGKDGIDGTNGTNGAQGPAGTANVIYSDWVIATSWTNTIVYGIDNFSFSIPAPPITTDILNTGMVLVYARLNGYNSLLGLYNNPVQLAHTVSYFFNSVIQNDNWNFIASPGNIEIKFINDHNLYTTTGPAAAIHQFRYIIVPGGVSVSGNKAALNYDKTSYAEVCKYLNIPE